jgi:hypothetical protein
MINNQISNERPVLKLVKYGVALHFLGTNGSVNRPHSSSTEFSSFERDLASYSYRLKLPFYNRVLKVPEDMERIEIQFPKEIVYLSEGKKFKLVCDGIGLDAYRSRYVQLRASKTYFQSGLSVFHLVLTAETESEESELNEYDLVKLAKLWEGGEGIDDLESEYSIERYIRFQPQNRIPMTIQELANTIFGSFGPERNHIRTGTIQLITEIESQEKGSYWKALWERLHSIKEGNLANASTSTNGFRGDDISKGLLGMAGILQGLLDFDNIDLGELADVFGEVDIKEDSLLGIHKGTLLYASAYDRAYEVTAQSIGISPYLLIPHSVLIHNEELLRRASEAASKSDSKQFRALENARREMHRMLDRDYLPNIFHYPTERMIYQLGENSRGLTDLKQSVRSRLSEVNAEWEARTNRRRRIAEDMIAGFLLILSGMQLKDVIPLNITIPVLSVAALVYIIWRLRT